MVKIKDFLKEKIKDKKVIQTIILLASTVIGLLLGFTTNSLLTRILGKVQYGNYALVVNIYTFCQVIFNFGIYYSIARLVAITNDQRKIRGYYAVGCFLTFSLFLLMSITLVGFSYFSDAIEKNNLHQVFLLSIPLSWAYILTNFNESFLQGDNRINLLSISRLLPRFAFAVVLIIIFYFVKKSSLSTIIFLNYITLIIGCLVVYIKLKPLKSKFRRRLFEVFIAVKQFGFDIYLGSLVASGSGSLSGILISYFSINNIEVGYFTLATLLCSPLALIPNIIATVQFKKFANSDKIQHSLTLITLVISLVLLLSITLLAKFIIMTFFGEDYINAIEILRVLSFGYILYGFGDYFNRFLLAKGKGRELRNASIYIGITLLIANFIFIAIYGAMGAALARIISGLMYIFVILYYYNKEIKL